MPTKLSEYVSATEAFAVFEEEFEGSFIPIASNAFEGAGVHDEELWASRSASAMDLSSLGHDVIGFKKSSGKSATDGMHHLG